VRQLLDEVKAREAQGYAYEAADASFELLVRRILGGVPDFFEVEKYQIGVERKIVVPGVTYSTSQAVVKIRIGEERLISAAEGNGPVNALDLALRKDLGVYQEHIEDLEFFEYHVRVRCSTRSPTGSSSLVSGRSRARYRFPEVRRSLASGLVARA
jgi:2-isopropylmalate synthase